MAWNINREELSLIYVHHYAFACHAGQNSADHTPPGLVDRCGSAIDCGDRCDAGIHDQHSATA